MEVHSSRRGGEQQPAPVDRVRDRPAPDAERPAAPARPASSNRRTPRSGVRVHLHLYGDRGELEAEVGHRVADEHPPVRGVAQRSGIDAVAAQEVQGGVYVRHGPAAPRPTRPAGPAHGGSGGGRAAGPCGLHRTPPSPVPAAARPSAAAARSAARSELSRPGQGPVRYARSGTTCDCGAAQAPSATHRPPGEVGLGLGPVDRPRPHPR